MSKIPREIGSAALRCIGACTVVAVALGLSASCSLARPQSAKPNIVLIVADDLGWGELGSYGQTAIKTPNIDQLAAAGMRFTQFYSASPVCAPTRRALMTGVHVGNAPTSTNGLENFLRAEDTTIAQLLRAGGYRTACIGKWALGSPNSPKEKGFDYYFGFIDQNDAHNYYPDHLWENGAQVDIPANHDGKQGTYAPDLFLDKTLQFLRNTDSTPFFLYLAHTLPHANNELAAATGNGMQVPNDAPYSDRDWPQVERNYAAMITRLDSFVGEVMRELRTRGLAEHTIVFFTSDNGPAGEGLHTAKYFNSSGGLRSGKGTVYEGGIRVPMIAVWPGHIAPGKTNTDTLGLIDFFPTALELAGLPASPRDGISMLPALTGHSQPQHEYMYWAFGGPDFFREAVRLQDWKGVRPQADHFELWDPLESTCRHASLSIL